MNDAATHKPKILTELVNSSAMGHFLYDTEKAQNQLNENIKKITDDLIRCGKVICEEYSILRKEFNRANPKSSGAFIAPEVRIDKNKGPRTYLSFRWVKFINGTYVGKPSRNADWTIREIERRGILHYSKVDFEKATHSKCPDFMQTILEAEHCMRFLRIQYLQLNKLCSFSRTMKLNPPLSYYAVHDLADLGDVMNEQVRKAKLYARNGYFDADPFCLPKSISLFDEFHQDIDPVLTDDFNELDEDLEF